MFIQTITSYRFVISDLEQTDGSELLVAQLRKRVAELKAKYRTEIEFELLELNGSVARHPSQMNNGSPIPVLTIDDL
jgi:hypothetical protein